MVRLRRTELATSVGSPPIVMGRVFAQNRPQVPSAEDEHPVGDLGPGGEHEPFRISVRPRTSRRDLHATIPALARTASNDAVNCPVRSRIRNRMPVARSPRSVSRLQICCVVHTRLGPQ